MPPEYLFLAGLALLSLILLRRIYGRQKTSPVQSESAITHAQTESIEPANVPVELDRWQVEMYETARNLKAEIDTKMGLLQQLIAMAESKRTELEQAIARANATDAASPSDSN